MFFPRMPMVSQLICGLAVALPVLAHEQRLEFQSPAYPLEPTSMPPLFSSQTHVGPGMHLSAPVLTADGRLLAGTLLDSAAPDGQQLVMARWDTTRQRYQAKRTGTQPHLLTAISAQGDHVLGTRLVKHDAVPAGVYAELRGSRAFVMDWDSDQAVDLHSFLPALPEDVSLQASVPLAISPDGQRIVGVLDYRQFDGGPDALYPWHKLLLASWHKAENGSWQAKTASLKAGEDPSRFMLAHVVVARNGQNVAGTAALGPAVDQQARYFNAINWRAGATHWQPEAIGSLPGFRDSFAAAVTEDGKIIGVSLTLDQTVAVSDAAWWPRDSRVFIWDPISRQMSDLFYGQYDNWYSLMPQYASADGSVVVGVGRQLDELSAIFSLKRQAFRWTRADGIQALNEWADSPRHYLEPCSLSADGQVVLALAEENDGRYQYYRVSAAVPEGAGSAVVP